MDVIFDKRIAPNFLSNFASAISSKSIANGTTFLKDSLNKQVFNKNINIIDKGNIKKANGSRYFDSEGVKIKELNLVKNGILNDFLIETYSGKKIQRKSNGRSSGTTNLYFESGNQTFEQLKILTKKYFILMKLLVEAQIL